MGAKTMPRVDACVCVCVCVCVCACVVVVVGGGGYHRRLGAKTMARLRGVIRLRSAPAATWTW